MADYLTDEQFLGGSAAAPAAQPTKYLTDEQFLGGAPAGKYLTDDEFLGSSADKSVPFGSIGRGWNRLQQAGDVLLEETGIISPESAAKAIAGHEADIAQYPTSPTYKAGMKEIGEAGKRGWGPLAYAMLTNPSTMLSVVGESIPASGAMLGAGVLGSPLGTPGLMAGTGLASFATEYSSSILDVLQENKVDTSKADELEKALQNKELMSKARDRAVKRGIPIGIFDAISFGIAGRIAHVIGTTTRAARVAGHTAEIAAQAAAGGGGEYAGEKLAGQPTDPAAIALEAGAEVVTGLPEVAIGEARHGGETQPPPPGPAEDIIPPEEGVPTPPGYIRTSDLPPAPPPAPVTTLPAEAAPAPAPTPALAETILNPAETQKAAEVAKVPDSPRLTPADRASPIPNEIIDAGKRAVEAATGQEAKVTTANVVDGHVQVTDTNVSDIVTKDRAETAALIDRITAGVAPAEIAPETGQPAPPARDEAVAGVGTPAETIAAPPASPAEAPLLSPAVAEHHAAANAPAPESLPAIPGTPMAKQGDTLADQIKKLKARAAAYDADVAQLAASGTSIRMVSNTNPNKKVLIGPDMSAQDKGKFRVTYIDQHGPSGHTVHNTMEDAARQVIGSYHPIGQIAREAIKQDTAFTPGGRDIPVTYAIVEASDLVTSQRDEGGANPDYPQELQPRDRSRGTSDIQINEIAQKLNPALLDNNVSATDGAPIVSPEGVVESGNGRILGIRRAYGQGLATAEGYKQYLIDQGYLDSVTAKSMKNPVLVRIRQAPMEMGERAAFAREANQRTTMEMSEPEQAMADANALTPETLAHLREGEIGAAANQNFVQAFARTVVSPNEQGAMVTSDGELSQKAVRRIRAALVAKAYGDANLVSTLFEDKDTNIAAIGGALMDAAGPWAKMRAETAAGTISPDADVTNYLLDAVRLIQRARNAGRPVAEFVSQTDVFSGKSVVPEAEMLMALMFRNTTSWTQPAGRAKIADALTFYAQEALKTHGGVDLLGEAAPASHKILAQAKARQYGQEETEAALAGRGRTAGKDTGTPAKERAVEAKPRPESKTGASVSREVPAGPKFSLGERVAKPTEVTLPGGQTATIEHPDEETFNAVVDGKRVGQMNLTLKRAAPYATSVQVTGQRRLGIATALYDAAEKVLGRRLIPSPLGMSPEAIAFWKNRLSKMEPEEKQALLAEALKVGQDAGVGKSARQRVDALGYLEPAPKFSLGERVQKPGKVGVVSQLKAAVEKLKEKQLAALKERLNTPKIKAAIAKMAAIPPTDKEDGTGVYKEFGPYASLQWWASRIYNFGTPEKPVHVRGMEEAVPLLLQRARTLAIDELNEDLAKAGKPLLEQYTTETKRKATIIIGPPAAGKSTIANAIALRRKATIVDVDDAKKVIPEYYTLDEKTGKMKGGIGANAVHEESSALGTEVLRRAIANGDNLVLPKVGDKIDSMNRLRSDLQAQGYTVEMVLMDVSPQTALGRMLSRFNNTGRLINPDYFVSVAPKPAKTYVQAINEGKFDGYSRVVSKDDGLPARVSEASGKASSLARGEGLKRDGTIEPGGRGEGPSAAQSAQEGQGQPKLKVGEAAPAPSGRSETRQVRGGQIHYAIGAAFAPKAEAFLKDFRKILDGYGLTGVSVKGWEMIFADLEHGAFGVEGQYLHGLIDVALHSKDPTMTLHHEAVHALIDLALSPSEKAILLRKSHKEWITDDIKQRYGAMSRAVQAEEGIAHAYVRWLEGERMDGMIARTFKRIKTYLKALLQALTKYDIRTADDVFRQMASGEIGRRTQVAQSASGARFDIAPPVLSTAFKKWFGKSKAVDAKGKPLVLYHGTIGNIDVFDPVPSRFSHDVGSHFGSATQASNILESRRERSREGKPITNEGENIYPVYVSIENPLRVTDEDWTGQPLLFAHDLYKKGQITEAEMMSLMPEGYTLRQVVSADMDGGAATRSGQRDKVVALLKSKGYDGLVYANKYEGKGDSWVVFDPGQVKSAIANVGTYDRNNPNIRYMFGGSRAETLDRAGLMRAQDMKDAGASRDEIYDETGFFVGHEGRWRFEINDDDAVLDMSGAQQRPNSEARAKLGTLGSILKHPKLFAAYPSLADIPTTVVVQKGTGYSGDYQPDPASESIEVVGRTEEEARSILLHEVMHALQTREDFAQGGNPSMGEDYTGLEGETAAVEAAIAPLHAEWEAKAAKGDYDSNLGRKINNMRENLVRKARHQYYRRIAGEVEARNVQARDAMRQKAKETGDQSYQPDAPWWTQDTNADKVIFVHSKNDKAFKATTETVDMFEGKREQYVIPGAEKLTDAQLAQRRANEKLQAKKPQKNVEALPLFGDQKDQLPLFSKPPSGPNDPRFNINTPPHNAQQSQQVMQGFIARGQLLDRAIRVPFSLLGGTKGGVWHWGKRLDEKMGATGPQKREAAAIGGIVGAGIGTFVGGPGLGTAAGAVAGGTVGRYILGGEAWPTSGPFSFFRNFAENAKRGLITNYGLDPEYVETFRQSELYKDMKAREGAGHLKVLHNAGVGTAEAKVLQAILSGEPVNDADMIRLAVPIRQAIDDMGAEAVSLGQISAESFERNRGAYLHRVYAKNEVDQSTLSGWVSNKMASRRKKIIGDQLKGRGMFWDLATDRLMQDAGAHPVPTKGDKWRVLDNTASTGKVMKRVYFPANKPIPMEFSGASWVDRGEWEVRQIGSGKATLWRDYTKAERDKMGEITDARYTIAKTFMLMANDLGTGKFYHDIAAKAEWTQTAEPAAGTWKEGGEYNAMNGRYWEDPDLRWVKVPDTAIAKTGGKKTWGALAGKFVRAEIWRDINELHLANNPGTWRKLFRQWKANHTYRHPVVHMNNVMSNVTFMDMADVRMQDLVGGIKAYASGGKDYREALDNGAFGADTVSQELRDKVLKPILDEITKQQTGATNPFLAKAGIAGVIADKLWSWAKTADDGMMRAYRAEDEIFRMALYMRRRSLGDSPRRAALEARDQFLNYDIRAPWVVAMRNTLLPFISYTYRAVPMIMHSIQLRPWKIAKYAAVAYAVNALAYMLDDWDDDDKDKKDGETRERAALQDQEQGYTWLGSPRMIRMPWRDGNGLPVFLDVRRWIPAGDVFDTTQGSAALPMPGPLNFGGPLQLAFEYNLNRKAFSGDDITNDLTQTNAEKFTSVVDWAWKAWTPPSFWNPGSYYWAKISNALHGATDAAGHPYTVPQALLSSIGIKVKPVDVENGIMWHYFDFKQVQTALKKDLRSLSRQLERGLISQSAFDSGAAKIMDKFETLGRNIDEFSKQTEPPKKGQ